MTPFHEKTTERKRDLSQLRPEQVRVQPRRQSLYLRTAALTKSKAESLGEEVCFVLTPESLLTRDRTAAELTAHGFPVAAKTLATLASRGGGPPFRKFGPRAIYSWADALDWAQARLSAPQYSTSDRDACVRRSAPAGKRGGRLEPRRYGR